MIYFARLSRCLFRQSAPWFFPPYFQLMSFSLCFDICTLELFLLLLLDLLISECVFLPPLPLLILFLFMLRALMRIGLPFRMRRCVSSPPLTILLLPLMMLLPLLSLLTFLVLPLCLSRLLPLRLSLSFLLFRFFAFSFRRIRCCLSVSRSSFGFVLSPLLFFFGLAFACCFYSRFVLFFSVLCSCSFSSCRFVDAVFSHGLVVGDPSRPPIWHAGSSGVPGIYSL